MPEMQVQGYLDQLRELQDQILTELEDMERAALRYETDSSRWNTVRRVLLRFGDHLREHTTQLSAARDSLGATQTMPQRMLARSMEAYGALLGAMVGLDGLRPGPRARAGGVDPPPGAGTYDRHAKGLPGYGAPRAGRGPSGGEGTRSAHGDIFAWVEGDRGSPTDRALRKTG